jgi:outer membrane protein TolC
MKQASDVGVQNVREGLAFRTVQTYINLIRARLGYQLILHHEDNVKSYLDRIRSMVDEGAADETELQQARDVSIILDNFRADYQGQLRAAESEYFELTGHLPEGDLFEPPSVKPLLPASLETAIATIPEHPGIRSIALQSQARAYDKDAEKAALYPDVNGELSYLERDQRDVIGGEATDARAVIKMNWAFETGGAQLARIKKRSIEHQDLMYRKQDAQRQIERGVRLAYAELDTAQIQNANQD